MKEVKVAAFDTRLAEQDLNFTLRVLVKTIGYAASKMADILTKKGGNFIAPPEGFIVAEKEGPLKPGELDRTTNWAKKFTYSK